MCQKWFLNVNEVPVGSKMKRSYHGEYIMAPGYVDGEAYFVNLDTNSYIYKNQQKWMASNKAGARRGW